MPNNKTSPLPFFFVCLVVKTRARSDVPIATLAHLLGRLPQAFLQCIASGNALSQLLLSLSLLKANERFICDLTVCSSSHKYT